MYKNEKAFVRGQKIKLGMIALILIILAIRSYLTGQPFLQ